jgi:Zn-dependent peptidase ImmA (M78 family)
MQPALKGLYADNIIWINRCIPTVTERACILAEELGHYHTSVGNILDQTDIRNRKQERRARTWAYERLVPLSKIVQAYHAGATDRHELAEYFGVTEEFLQAALKRYREKYGTYAMVDKHIVYFDPLAVAEMFD